MSAYLKDMAQLAKMYVKTQMKVEQMTIIGLLPLVTSLVAIIGVFLFWYTTQRGGIVLNRKRLTLKIGSIEKLSEDTKKFRLMFPRTGMTFGLPVGKHVKIMAQNPSSGMPEWNGKPNAEAGKKEIERYYTPVTGNAVKGYMDLVSKQYRCGTVKMPDGKVVEWSDGGKMTGCFLDSKQVGDEIVINGPFGLLEYLGNGMFKLPGIMDPRHFKHVALMAGGSGITPVLQVLMAAVEDETDPTTFSLIYANRTERDILCHEQLLDLERQSGGKVRIEFTVSHPASKGWTGSTGHITESMIETNLPHPSRKPLVLLCGPPGMVENACKKNLAALKYDESDIFVF